MSKYEVYVVYDKGTNQTSVWSNKPYAIAEVQAVKRERYNNDMSIIGKQLFFVAESIYNHSNDELDCSSMVYGTDYMKHELFIDADNHMKEIREARKRSRSRN